MQMPAATHRPWIGLKQEPVWQTLFFALCLPRNAACCPLISRHHIHPAGHHNYGIPLGIPLLWNGRLRTAACSREASLGSSRPLRVPVATFARRGFGSIPWSNATLRGSRKLPNNQPVLRISIIRLPGLPWTHPTRLHVPAQPEGYHARQSNADTIPFVEGHAGRVPPARKD